VSLVPAWPALEGSATDSEGPPVTKARRHATHGTKPGFVRWEW
jgi:hypothetical protein